MKRIIVVWLSAILCFIGGVLYYKAMFAFELHRLAQSYFHLAGYWLVLAAPAIASSFVLYEIGFRRNSGPRSIRLVNAILCGFGVASVSLFHRLIWCLFVTQGACK